MRLERIFWFYHKLKENAYPSRDEYLRRLEVSKSTFKRDIEYFRERINAPIEFDRTRKGYYLTDASYELPSYWFSRSHLLMLIGVCRQLTEMSAESAPEIDRFRKRIEGLLRLNDSPGLTVAVSFENEGWRPFDVHFIDDVIDAIMARRMVRVTYHAKYTDKTSVRDVEPYRLHNYKGDWHLIGFCHLRGLPRVFSLAGFKELEMLDSGFSGHRFDVDDFLKGSFGIYRGGEARRVVIRFTPYISRFVRGEIWHREQEMTTRDDGGVDLTVPVTHLTEIRMKVMAYGPHAEVLKPEELRRRVAEDAAGMLKIYEKNF